MQQLGAQDSQFLYMESDHNLSNVTMVSIYSPPESIGDSSLFDHIKEHVQARLHTSQIFKRKLVRVPMDIDYPYWAEDEFFDFESHLQLHRLSAPADWQQFSDLVGRVHSRPLDMNRPLWEMHLVENLDGLEDYPPGSFAILSKIHHAAVDGAAMVKFFSGLSDLDKDGTPLVDISKPVAGAGEAPSARQIWRRALFNNVRSPLKLAETLWRAAPVIAPAAVKAVSKSDSDETKSKVPTTRLNKTVSPRKIFDAVAFELADLKLIQASVDASKINDIVLAISSAALRSYLLHHNGLPADSLVAWVPINTRTKVSPGEETDGNSVTVMTTDLHTDLSDPIERLKQITRQTQLSKAAKSGVSARIMTDVSKHMPGATMALASRIIASSGMAAKLSNVAISNVPGPQIPVYLHGAKCLQQFGLVPLGEGLGLFLVALSYNGKLTISITTTKDIIPDMAIFRGCLISAMAELKQAASKKKKPSRRTVRKTTAS